MFEQLSSRATLRAVSTVPTAENTDFQVADTRTGSIAVVMRVSGRTTGSVRAQLYGSVDGGSTYTALLADTGSISVSSGVGYMLPKGPMPVYLRVVLTPSGGFDGNVGLIERAAGLLNFGQNNG